MSSGSRSPRRAVLGVAGALDRALRTVGRYAHLALLAAAAFAVAAIALVLRHKNRRIASLEGEVRKRRLDAELAELQRKRLGLAQHIEVANERLRETVRGIEDVDRRRRVLPRAPTGRTAGEIAARFRERGL